MEREETLLILQVLPVMFVDPYSLLRIRDFGEEYCVCSGQNKFTLSDFFIFLFFHWEVRIDMHPVFSVELHVGFLYYPRI